MAKIHSKNYSLKELFHPLIFRGVPTIISIALWYFLFLGVVLTFLIPPFQKPDEYAHFFKTVAIANGQIYCASAQSYPIQAYLQQFIDDTGTYDLQFNFWNKVHYQRLLHDGLQKNRDLTLIQTPINVCGYPTISYLPQGIAVAATLAVGLPPLVVFYSGRIVMLLVAFITFLALIRLIPKKYVGILVLFFCLPMSIHQLTSYSYDAMLLLAGATLFVFFLRALSDKQVKTSNLIGISIALTLIFLTKNAGYELLVLLPLILLLQKRKVLNKKLVLSILGVILLPIMVLISPKLAQISSVFGPAAASNDTTYDITIDRIFVNPGQQMQVIRKYPLDTAFLFINTSAGNQTNYVKGLVSMFGWLDYEIAFWITTTFMIAFGIIVYAARGKPAEQRLTFISMLVLLVIIVGTYFLIQLGLYLYWMPVGVRGIEGVQGRYFLPVLPFVALFISQILSSKKTTTVLAVILIICAIVSIAWSVSIRYYYTYRIIDTVASEQLRQQISPNGEREISAKFDQSNKKLIGFRLRGDKRSITSIKHLYLNLKIKPGCSDTYIDKPVSVYQVLADKDDVFLTSPLPASDQGVCVQIDNVEFPMSIEPQLLQ